MKSNVLEDGSHHPQWWFFGVIVPDSIQFGEFCCCEHLSLIWHCPSSVSGFDCRCGNLFCGLHRYSDKHNCPYDYRTEAADKIRKENPVVVADKIQRIWRGLSVWLWILGAIRVKKKKPWTWAQLSVWRTCFSPLVCYTFSIFSPVHESSLIFSAFILVCVRV